jgi:TetR/AcrR family transcriptional regulator
MNENNSALSAADASTSSSTTSTVSTSSSPPAAARSLAPARARVGSKREELLRCAREQFAAKGFVATPIAAVASSVQIRKSTFFHYFQDKDALYDAAVRAILDDLAQNIVDTRATESYDARLEELVALVWRFLSVEPSLPRLLLRAIVDEPAAEAPRPTALDRIVQSFADTVQRGVEENVIAPCDPLQEAMGIISFLCAHATTDSALTVPIAKDKLIGMTAELRLSRVQQRVRAMLPSA